MTFYTFLNKDELNNKEFYTDDFNPDIPIGHGFIIDTADNILCWCHHGPYLAKININDNAKLSKIETTWATFYKVNSFTVSKIYDIYDTDDIDQMAEDGIDLHVNNEMLLTCAISDGYETAAKHLIDKHNANVSVDDSLPLRLAIYHNRIHVLPNIIKNGADFTAMRGMPKILALKFGNESTLKTLRKYYNF